MRILVVDVAAEHSGAVTILNQFIDEFKAEVKNEYYVVLSVLDYQETENVYFLKLNWVKRSHIHRLFFDNVYIKKLIHRIRPDMVLSLQNKTVSSGRIPQDVYFHNVLPIAEKRFKLRESKKLWVYQNVIGLLVRKSLKKARNITVQAEWIKRDLSEKWKIDEDRIFVKRPRMNFSNFNTYPHRNDVKGCHLFYPANGAIYKNHISLLKACAGIWDSEGLDCGLTLTLTGKKDDLSKACQALLDGKSYPVHFVGRLNSSEMSEMYNCTALVFPSYMETIGLPLLEAMHFQCDILAADCKYVHETLDGYNNVAFFDPFDVMSIELSIRKHMGLLEKV